MKSTETPATTDYTSFRRSLASIVGMFLPPETTSIKDSVITALVLLGSLIVVIPALELGLNIPLLVLVPIAGMGYAFFVYRTNRVFSGLVSAFFVLTIFQANIPVIDGPMHAGLSLYLVDPLAIVLFSVLIYDFNLDFNRAIDTKLGIAAVLGLAVFVLWSYLAAAVGNGPSQIAAVIFAIQQTRYLFIFVVSILIVIQVGPKYSIYPLLLSISGNLLYAVAEAFSGNTFGLTYLGDSDGRVLSELILGSWTFSTGLYAGGFVGNTRHLIGLLLLLLPFLVYWTVYGSRLVTLASVFGILGVEFIIKFGETDAGWLASILVLATVGGFYLHSLLVSGGSHSLRGCIASVFGASVSVLFYSKRFQGVFWSLDTDRGGTSSTTGGESGASEAGPSSTTGDTGGGKSDLSNREIIVDLLSHIPFIEVNTLGIRLTQYTTALNLSLSHPLFGIGGYNFILISGTYLESEMGIHNIFLSHLVAVGYPGLFAYMVGIFSTLILTGYHIYTSSGRERLFWVSALSGQLGFHAYSFWVVMYQWHAPNMGFWVFSGIIIGALAFGPVRQLTPQ
jgi:hypothetical protein